jgi:hypothetical protein
LVVRRADASSLGIRRYRALNTLDVTQLREKIMIDFPISSVAADGMRLSLPRCLRSRAATTWRCPQ